MTEVILHWFSNWPPELAVLVVSMLPVVEIRGAIPFGLHVLNLPFLQVYILGVIGNMLPVFLILIFLEWFTGVTERVPFLNRIYNAVFRRARKRFSSSYERYGVLALIIFTAIPFPLTGAWTASVAAVLFGIRKRLALPAIFIGILISGLIVGLIAGAAGGFLLEQIR